jgi:hypothetical protein
MPTPVDALFSAAARASWARARDVIYVSSATGRPHRSNSEICEQRLEEFFSKGERYLC